MRALMLVIALFFMPATACAAMKPLIADLSREDILIDSTFSGTSILLFGSTISEGNVHVILRGPEKNFAVWKKEKRAGIWMNTSSSVYNNFPSLLHIYSITTGSKIDPTHAREFGIPDIISSSEKNSSEFDSAFISHFSQNNLLKPASSGIKFMGETLFKVMLMFPVNIPQGKYTAEVYLLDTSGDLIASEMMPITVKKTGIDSKINDISSNHPSLYGIIAIIMALLGGAFASYIFKKISV